MRPDFTLHDLVVAYRKAKVDLYYSNDGRYLDLASYEETLEDRLKRLMDRLNDSHDFSWIDEAFVGGHRIVPKTVKAPETGKVSTGHEETHIYSSPGDQWNAIFSSESENDRPFAEVSFRLMSHCSIDMHVVSALWMREVGIDLDALLSDSARGNRLRRDRNGEYNDWSLGSFEKYLWPYKRWRDDGFNVLEQALAQDKDVYCLTADATGFFHGVSPRFLELDSDFWVMLKEHHAFGLDSDDVRRRRIHEVFVTSLRKWQEVQNEVLRQKGVGALVEGLPVGLPASGLVANLALLEFDKDILKEVRPLYYGRYVDDVMLVWEDLSRSEKIQPLRNVSDVWDWLRTKSELFSSESSLAKPSHSSQALTDDSSTTETNVQIREGFGDTNGSWMNADKTKQDHLRFCPTYHSESTIEFSNVKNRLYSMGGSTGRNLLATLRSAAAERSSEWRMMPELPKTRTEVSTSVSRAKNIDGDAADSFSSLEGIAVSRSNFAITLRNFEAFTRDIEHRSWAEQRSEFFQAVRDYVLTPFTVFEMDRYIGRVLNLALNCRQPDEFIRIVEKYLHASTAVLKDAYTKISGLTDDETAGPQTEEKPRASSDGLFKWVLSAWREHTHGTVVNSLVRSGLRLPGKHSRELFSAWHRQGKEWHEIVGDGFQPKRADLFFDDESNISTLSDNIQASFVRLFHRDLAEQPYREHLLPIELSVAKNAPQNVEDYRDNGPLGLFEERDRIEFYKFFGLLDESLQARLEPIETSSALKHGCIADDDSTDNVSNLQADRPWSNLDSLWGLVFPTRPFTASEMFDISNILRYEPPEQVSEVADCLSSSLLISRGYGVTSEALRKIRQEPKKQDTHDESSERSYINLSTAPEQLFGFLDDAATGQSISNKTSRSDVASGKVRIAVSMFETPEKFVAAALHRKPDLSAKRYRALTRLVNQTIQLHPKPHYLVLGELAIPPSWFNAISLKLATAGINLIAGVEYIHATREKGWDNTVHNQVWVSLRHSTLGHYTSCTYKQDKQEAAHGEREMLDRELRLRMDPEYEWRLPPIIRHDDHYFGILICSELTNINYRANFRGRIDTLFVPQWNQDLNTFTALVESAALDVHSHVVQVNNRMYGDTRIRMPAGDQDWKRDVVQLKGGLNDYLVVAELDLNVLRVFQTKSSSRSRGYKPLPDGFRIDPNRARVH